MSRVIASSLSPNTQSYDVMLAFRHIIQPWTYIRGGGIEALEKWFQKYFAISYVSTFSNARSGLYVILKSLAIREDDEVILQAFTCVVVPNAVLAVGAIPVYADITKSLTLDCDDVVKKITKKTKAIIVQHTFGIPGDMQRLQSIARKYNLFLIEDVAHTIGGTYKGKKLGTFGIASIFSFGRDKAFSSVFGGVTITSDQALGAKIKAIQLQVPYPKQAWIAQQLFHPIAFVFILALYNTSKIGKIILFLLQKMHTLSFPVSSDEKAGKFNPESIKRFPNALALLAVQQITKIDDYNKKRVVISEKYKQVCKRLHIANHSEQNVPYLRFPIFVKDAAKMKEYFRNKRKVYLGDWYANIIDPKGSNFTAIGYRNGSCPVAEKYAKEIINLPTYPTMSDNDIAEVMQLLEFYDTHKRN